MFWRFGAVADWLHTLLRANLGVIQFWLSWRLRRGRLIVKKAIVIGVVAITALAASAIIWRTVIAPSGNTSNDGGAASLSNQDASYQTERQIHALGRLEPAGGVITIGAMVGDRLETLHVREGERVQKGQLLAELASQRMRKLEEEALATRIKETEARRVAEEAAADARIRVAELNVEKANSSDAEITAQEKQVTLAESNLELVTRDLQRFEGLSTSLVSKQELERQRLLVKKAEAELAAARAALNQVKQSSRFAAEAAQADLRAAEAAKQQVLSAVSLDSLRKQEELAKIQTEQTRLIAPQAGTVLWIFTRTGEFIASKPVLQMADLSRLHCVAEVYEADVPYVRPNQKVLVTSPVFTTKNNEVQGVVTRVGGMVSTPELRSIDPFAPTDRHVVEVHIELDDEDLPDKARLVNLQVDVKIVTSGEKTNDENSAGVAQSRP